MSTEAAKSEPPSISKSSKSSPSSRSRGRFMTYFLGAPKLHLGLIAVLLITTLGVTAWRFASVSSLEHQLDETRRDARAAMLEQSGELLQLSANPLAWAIRAELLANDLSDIDAYMIKLVQEKYVKRIAFIDQTGTIIASTNVKLKGQKASVALADVKLDATRPRIEQAGGDLRMVVPVMDFERQIGALVLDYSTGSIDTKLSKLK